MNLTTLKLTNLQRTLERLCLFAKRLATFIYLLLILGLNACVGLSPSSQGPSNSELAQQQEMKLNALLAEAEMSQSPKRETLLLQAAEQLMQQSKLNRAHNLLASLDPGVLSDKQFITYTLVFSETTLAEDAYFLAQRILTNPRLDQQWQSLSREDEITLRLRRADLFMLLGEPELSILERFRLHTLLTENSDASISNQNNLWQALMTIPVNTLETLSKSSKSEVLRGWYNLALISKNNQSNLEKQLQLVNQWIANWPQHPASFTLPKDLQLLKQLVETRPKQVALLLPDQGRLAKAGAAIRDGFIAAYYRARTQQATIPELKFYDSANGDIRDIYQNAVDSGAEIVVGPLDKDKVTQLAEMENRPIPVLAVNYSDSDTLESPNLYQFGLSIEDEARQTAQRAWIEGHRYTMILTTDADWGLRSAEIFRQQWESMGGTVVEQSQFRKGESLSKVIGQAMLIDQSEARAKSLQGVLAEPLEAEPRRRQDADILFLTARPEDARQIKPTLAFHYASDLPVYATSHAYSGSQDQKSDQDLNGIIFSTLPWFFDNELAEKKVIRQALDLAPSYQRLYALGVDSFHLYPRLQQLEQSPQTRFYGVTGALQLDSQRRIHREQVWAKISNGKAYPLSTAVGDN